MRFLNVYEEVCVRMVASTIDQVKCLKFHQKNAPKSMKNVRFGSGFLHVIRKMIPQQFPNVSITLKPSVSEK